MSDDKIIDALEEAARVTKALAANPNVVSLNDRRKDTDRKPDANCVYRDVVNGQLVTTYRFCGSYDFGGEQWVFDIWAESFEQAEAKLKAIGTGRIDGQVFTVTPA